MKRFITVYLTRSDCDESSVMNHPIAGCIAMVNTLLDNNWCVIKATYEDLDITDELTNACWLNRLGVK